MHLISCSHRIYRPMAGSTGCCRRALALFPISLVSLLRPRAIVSRRCCRTSAFGSVTRERVGRGRSPADRQQLVKRPEDQRN